MQTALFKTIIETLKLQRIDSDPIPVRPEEIRVFAVVRNENLRLPSFFSHYRKLKADRFFIIDNGSTDGTLDFLLSQKNTHIFKTNGCHKLSASGSQWINRLLKKYGTGHWCLTVDADELLIYPHYETVSLKDLCSFLTAEQASAMHSILLDMYSQHPVKDAHYHKEHNPLDTFPFFDSNSHVHHPHPIPRYSNARLIKGGMRKRVFCTNPCLNKTVLFKFQPGMSLSAGQHFITKAKFSRIEGAVLHFKYASDFIPKTFESTQRQKHPIHAKEYQTYLQTLRHNPDISLYHPDSVRFKDSQQLMQLKIMRAPQTFTHDYRASAPSPRLDILYDKTFATGPLRNKRWAEDFCALILTVFNPQSVIDFGCGTGDLLKPFEKRHLSVLGIDGSRYCQTHSRLRRNHFLLFDLRKHYTPKKRYDLCLCLEVAEHIEESHSDTLIKTLTQSSDTVIFTAAPPGQDGHHHVNLKPQDWWIKRFQQYGFEYDASTTQILKSQFNRIPHMQAWYRDNLMIFHNSNQSRPVRITPADHASQLLYFTSSSLTADDKTLIFIGDHNGNPNLFSLDLSTGKHKQLTHNHEGYLKSYVYFDGRRNAGLGKASISLDPKTGNIYYIQGTAIHCIDPDGNDRILAEYPDDQVTAFTHISNDGTRLCVPTTDAYALDAERLVNGKPDYDIDERVRAHHLNSYLRVYDTASGKEIAAEPIPEAWVTHVQFSPVNNAHILYNHEWSHHCGVQRMWLWDGTSHKQLRQARNGYAINDWVCHENWTPDGQSIIYHGTYKNGPAFIGKMHKDGSDQIEIPLADQYKGYGHFTTGPEGLLVSDGYFREENPKTHIQTIMDRFLKNSDTPSDWISIQKINWKNKTIEWVPLCRHNTLWDIQDNHPHPVFNHSGNAVFFTLYQNGTRGIYKIMAPKDNR